jgi:predicted  nucleic acid-binding Zn-ribbon protein
MPEQTELVNYYLSSLQDHLAHVVKERALDEAKLNFKDAEMGELHVRLKELEERIENSSSRIMEVQDENHKLTQELEKATKNEKIVIDLEKKLHEAHSRNTMLVEKLDNLHRESKNNETKAKTLENTIAKLKEVKAKTSTRRRRKTTTKSS